MILFRLLNPQGIAGLAASVVRALRLIAAKVDGRHWRRQSAEFEQLYRAEVQAHAASLANVRAATERARAEDRANAAHVRSAQNQISERIHDDFEARLADARRKAAQAVAHRDAGLEEGPAGQVQAGRAEVGAMVERLRRQRGSLEGGEEFGIGHGGPSAAKGLPW